MYPIDERDRITALTDFPAPEGGAPEPIVVADEHAVVLCYLIEHGEGAEKLSKFCLVRFHSPLMHMLGAPNDETLQGHPLWKRGLDFYGAFRVEDSSLIRRLVIMNSVHERHDSSVFDRLTHYVITFHDSTFECVAQSCETAIQEMAWTERYEKAAELLQQRPPEDLSRFIKTDPISRLYRRLPSGLRFVVSYFR